MSKVITKIDTNRGVLSLVNCCKEATETYLEHSSKKEAQKQGKSQDIVDVTSSIPKITEDGVEIFEFEVAKLLKSNEFIIRDKHNRVEYIANKDFSVILYDCNNSVVTIKFNETGAILNTGFNHNIELSFDLRILIVNQRTAYESHSMDIGQPRLQPSIETKFGFAYVLTFEHPSLAAPNAEQEEAITTMLSSPQSFIEAPPGDRVDAIKDILSDVEGSVAILTPYKGQVSHLQKSLKGLIDSSQIMSIHKSQGQEWNTVIISVVDHQSYGAYGKYFTSSLNQDSNGLKIVNTAASRAKNRLIIVGHYGFWVAWKDELFCELFHSAEKINLYQDMSVA